jgi:phenylpropionate dioxygenase-like ring-hydroxylating dioxygenase large terminal subunit
MVTPTYVPGLVLDGAARQDMLDLMARMVDHYRDRTTDQADGPWREPVSHYGDPARFRREVDMIHRQVPLPLALSAELPDPGSHKALEVAGVPVVITRDLDGVVHAAVNACRHRGAELVPAGLGKARRLTCPYHGWAYELSGQLCGVYGERTFGPVDRRERALVSLPAQECAGVVFVGLTPGAEFDLGTWLGDALPALQAMDLGSCTHHATATLAGPNWKIAMDGYLESYHFASLHRTTVFRKNMSNLATFDAFGPHQRNTFALRDIARQADRPPAEWEPATGISPLMYLFPAMHVRGGMRDHVTTALVLPGREVGESVTELSIFLRRPAETDEDTKAADLAKDWLYRVVLEEDYAVGEGVQRGLGALAGTDFVFGRNEPAVQHFHQTINSYVRHRAD